MWLSEVVFLLGVCSFVLLDHNSQNSPGITLPEPWGILGVVIYKHKSAYASGFYISFSPDTTLHSVFFILCLFMHIPSNANSRESHEIAFGLWSSLHLWGIRMLFVSAAIDYLSHPWGNVYLWHKWNPKNIPSRSFPWGLVQSTLLCIDINVIRACTKRLQHTIQNWHIFHRRR